MSHPHALLSLVSPTSSFTVSPTSSITVSPTSSITVSPTSVFTQWLVSAVVPLQGEQSCVGVEVPLFVYLNFVRQAPAGTNSTQWVVCAVEGSISQLKLSVDADAGYALAVSPTGCRLHSVSHSFGTLLIAFSLPCCLTHLVSHLLTHSFGYSLTWYLTYLLTHSLGYLWCSQPSTGSSRIEETKGQYQTQALQVIRPLTSLSPLAPASLTFLCPPLTSRSTYPQFSFLCATHLSALHICYLTHLLG